MKTQEQAERIAPPSDGRTKGAHLAGPPSTGLSKLIYFFSAALLGTLLFFGVAYGEGSREAEQTFDARGLLSARALAWITGEQLTREGAGDLAGPLAQAMKQQLPGLERALVLKGTKFLAHTDPARVGGRLDSESLEDKALFDLSARLKATVRKNAEERERNPALTRDAYSIIEVRHEANQRATATPAIVEGDLAALAEVVYGGEPSPVALPFVLLLFAFGATAIYAAFASRLSGLNLALIGSTLLVAIVVGEVLTLAGWRSELRKDRATRETETIARLVNGGLLTGASEDDRRELVNALDRGEFGEASGRIVFVRSTTIAVGDTTPIPAALDIEKNGVAVSYSPEYFRAAAKTDSGQLMKWGAAIAFLVLALFNLGTSGRLARAGRTFLEHRYAYRYLAPAMLGLFVLVFIPVAYGILLAFQKKTYNVWEFAGLDNFISILSNFDVTNPQSFYFKLVVTIMWTVSNVSLHVGIGLFLALLLNDPILKAKGLFRVLLVVPWAVPNYITALIWRGLFHRQFGAINFFVQALGFEPISWFQTFWPAFTANVATNVWLGFPFMMVVSLGALQSIPTDLYEAAIVDGANRWQRFRNITLPLLLPALVPAVIVGSVWTFNMFNIIYLVSGGAPDGATDILITDAFRWAFERDQHGYGAAYSTLIFLILVAFTMVTNKLTKATKGAFE